MTLSRLLACSLCLTAAVASAEEYWASGIYQSDGTYYGWYDVNKTWDGDDNMCYAASASNLIAWWQAGRLESGLSLPSGVPNTAETIWGKYKSACIRPDEGGLTIGAINWWLSGTYLPSSPTDLERSATEYDEDAVITLKPFSGYYYDQYSLTRNHLDDFFDMYTCTLEEGDDPGTKIYAGVFADLLESGAGIGLGISSDNGELAHAVTLWGAEYTDENILSKIWLTDSDDDATSLFSVDVSMKGDKIYFDVENTFYEDYEGVFIDEVYAILPSEAKLWGIPEPSYIALPLITLAGLLVRRRRK